MCLAWASRPTTTSCWARWWLVVVPLLDGDEGDLAAVAGEERDELGVVGGAGVLEDDGGPGEAADPHEEGAVDEVLVAPGEADPHRLGELGLGRDVQDGHAVAAGGHDRCRAVLRRGDAEGPPVGDRQPGQGDALGQRLLAGQARPGGRVAEERAEPVDRGEAPLLLAPVRHREVGDVERRRALGPRLVRDHRRGTVGVRPLGGALGGQQAHQPTAPSICSSMSRLSSRAYSMGSSLAMGSTKPRTIIAIASSSVIPRDMR